MITFCKTKFRYANYSLKTKNVKVTENMWIFSLQRADKLDEDINLVDRPNKRNDKVDKRTEKINKHDKHISTLIKI
jgi:hypothetical protein